MAAVALACAAPAALGGPASAAGEYAHLNAPGPKLSESRSALRASLGCSGSLRKTGRSPVLLLAATAVDPVENYSWNWMPALERSGYTWCSSTAADPDNMSDIQARGERVVYAIRRMHRISGRRVTVYGHSQGGMVGRWALRFWPDTRAMVADLVGAAPSNHGTDVAPFICGGGCAPSIWQQRSDSQFTRALNSRAETFRGVAYTSIYSRLDEVVIPNSDETGSSSLRTGRGEIENVAVQDVCPGDVSEHLLTGVVDPVAWALFVDATTHPGPADPERIDRSVCSDAHMPGVDPATYATDLAAAGTGLARTLLAYPRVPEEPPLAAYAFAR